MKKSHIVNNIEKYHLGGLTKEVVWKLVGGQATINFATETKDAVGQIEFELAFIKSRPIQPQFDMLEEKNQFIKSFLYENDDRKPATLIKRAI